jgi:hypothetical protein
VLGRECQLADAPLDAERALLSRWGLWRGAGRAAQAPRRRASAAAGYLQPITS